MTAGIKNQGNIPEETSPTLTGFYAICYNAAGQFNQVRFDNLPAAASVPSHTHTVSDITDFTTEVNTLIGSATHTASDITDFNSAADARITAASLTVSQITDFTAEVNTLIGSATHTASDITDFNSAVDDRMDGNTLTFTNKTIDADNNTVSNIGAAEIKADIITGQTEKVSPVAGDFLLGYDTAGTTIKKFDVDNLPGGGSGDVVGPASATDNALVRFDSTTGKLLQNSSAILDDSNNLSGLGNISLSGTVDGRDVAADGTKLDGIEASATADQSDAEIETAYNTQVGQVSAGEKTAGTETAIRRFSPKDVADMAGTHGGGGGSGDVVGPASATDNALARFDTTTGKLIQNSTAILTDAGALSGLTNITLTGTVDGRDVATDGTKLDGIEASADVTDETNVKAAIDGMSLTDVGTPASTDKILLLDTSDSDNLKYADYSEFSGGGGGGITPQIYHAPADASQTITASLATVTWDTATFSDTGYSESAGVITIASDLNGKRARVEMQLRIDGSGRVELIANLDIDPDGVSGYTTELTWSNFVAFSSGHDTGALYGYTYITLATGMLIRVQAQSIDTGSDPTIFEDDSFFTIETKS